MLSKNISSFYLHYTTHTNTHTISQDLKIQNGITTPCLRVPIWGRAINSPIEDSPFSNRPERCSDNSSNLFLIDFFNIFGLCSNFHSVEHHLSSVALDISKAFDRVWHNSLLSKLPFFGFYPSLFSFISSFLSDRSISAVVDGHCFSPNPINSSDPQGSVLSPTLFLLFINDRLSVTNCHIHSYADVSTLHFSTSFDRRPTLQDLQDSRLEAAERLTLDLALISNWGRRNLVSFNASKTQFLHLSTRHNLPNSYPLFFNNTQLSPSSTLNILGLSFTQNFNWKLHSSSLTKSASSKLGVLYRLRQFLSPAKLISIYRGLVRPRMEYTLHV